MQVFKTSAEVQEALDALREKHGPGYAKDPAVAALQVRLSIQLEMLRRKEEAAE